MNAIDQMIMKYLPLVGEEISVGDWLKIDQNRIDKFAEVTGDEQWIHIDSERAGRESPFGTTVAHGFLTLSLLPLLTSGGNLEALGHPAPGMKLRVNYGLNKVRFPAPVKTGARIRARTVVTSVDAVKDGVQLILFMTVEIEGEAKPACVAEQIFRYYP